ncbi:MAG: acyl-ACP--UDP-N-acetylglucosamine O-acyltransferase [Verrucomicrobiota bacterium]|nr:acyl-ACP--UDP-N-acetylglucosamine O-acyltransferase [Verrucomicrobiota bacterium]
MSQESEIHPLAIVEPGAQLGKGVKIEPFAIVKQHVTLEDGVQIKAHAYIDGYTTIGEETVVWPGAAIGTKSQDLKYRGEKTFVSIGKRCEIREYATINSSCQENTTVRVGDDCLIMAYCHVAHNCELGNHVVMSNGAMLAGHVTVGDYARIGGMTPIHQFVRVGCHAMVGGFSGILRDIPPYTIGGGVPYRFGGINLVGLKRNHFSLEVRIAISKAFKLTFRSGLHLEEALSTIEREVPLYPEIQHWLEFCRSSKRGVASLEGAVKQEAPEEETLLEAVYAEKNSKV